MLRPDSRLLQIARSVELEEGAVAETRLRLESGSVDSRVPAVQDSKQTPRLEIRTPRANRGVCGTEFRTTTSATKTALGMCERTVASSLNSATGSAASASGSADAAASGQAVKAGFETRATTTGLEAPRALLAAPDLQTTSARVERPPVQLIRSISTGAMVHWAQVFAGKPVQVLVLSGLFKGTSVRWTDNLPDGRYELRMRAIDSTGLEGARASTAFTLKARPEPPFSTQPQSGVCSIEDALLFS